MLVKRVAIQNIRSFLDREELVLDGPITIVIGPNGGGKTNLLDTAVIMLRRHLFASMYATHDPTPEHPNRHSFRANDALNNLTLERHSLGADQDQCVEVEVEVTSKDIENMHTMRRDAERLTELASNKYINLALTTANTWNLENISAGMRFVYSVLNGNFQQVQGAAYFFLQYLQVFEMDGRLREEFDFLPLATPLVYLPVNRSASAFQSSVVLANYNDFEVTRHSDATSSRSGSSIVAVAVGRLAQKYRMLLEKDKGTAAVEFKEDKNLSELTALLKELGYDWSLQSINPMKNQYDIQLTKQGSSFVVSAASSGERELLTYLFAIFALNVRDALIIVDEPELHLHPKWQKTLLNLFVRLAKTTGNHFLLATHAPTFVSPESIQYVSRVFSLDQKSRVRRLDAAVLPESRHLLSIVNSQNNERLFFADKVVLVEGISDRIFFETLLDHFGRGVSTATVLEVISVGGKGLFDAYSKILKACDIQYSIIADRDYVEQLGAPEIKSLFVVDAGEIKTDVIDNVKSLDGDTLVSGIQSAMTTGSWEHAREVWAYITARRRQLRSDLTKDENQLFTDFVESKRNESVYLLTRGALEAYLPAGHASKELEKLIRLVSQRNFWETLPENGKEELELIARRLLQ